MRCRPALLGLVAVATALGACTGPAPAHVTMSVAPSRELSDATVAFSVRGLRSGSTVTVASRAVDRVGVTWSAHATFRVPADGVVTSSQPAISGSYTGSDPMGLLLFMRPDHDRPGDDAFGLAESGARFTFTATSGSTTLATADTYRVNRFYQDTVHRYRPRRDGIYGDVFTPLHATGRRPGVLVFGGSEGGVSGGVDGGATLAAHGYTTLGLAYFGEPGLPDSLDDIPLEYFERALTILRAQPGVDPSHVLVFGVSRGGEAALLIGATFPSLVDGVVAGVPNSNVYNDHSWTLHGRPVAVAPIAVQRIHGPILLSCGGVDAVWDSCLFTSQVRTRLAAHHFRYPVTSLRFPAGGHYSGDLACCFAASPAYYENYGGTLRANEDAQVAGSAALLRFLAQQ